MFLDQLNNFKRDMQQKFGANVNPQQIIQNLLNNGQMTQSQYNNCLNMANNFIGKR
jgi:hypothetical protein